MEATHKAPAWRHQANFIIGTKVSGSANGVVTEQLWARKTENEHYFEICCIPFFAYDLALGDVVETDDKYLILRVKKPSGRFVFRVFFETEFLPAEAVASAVIDLGALIEWSSPQLLAIDCRDESDATLVANFLQEQEDQGLLIYETGKS